MGAGRPGYIAAGDRDLLFMGSGWRWPERRGGLIVRRSGSGEATLALPLGRAEGPRRIQLRLSCPEPVRVVLNGVLVASLVPQPDAVRLPSYEVTLPVSVVRPGRNRLALEPEREGEIVFWSLTIAPPTTPAAAHVRGDLRTPSRSPLYAPGSTLNESSR